METDFNELVGKTIRVVDIDPGTSPQDIKWIGHEGKVKSVNKSPWGYQIWVENMSVALLSESDKWEIVKNAI